MAATLRMLEGEPILIVTHEGYLSLASTEEVSTQVAQVLRESPVPIYGILDLRAATSSFSEVLRILTHQSSGALGTVSNEDSYVVLVGTHVLLRLFQNLIHERKFGGVTLSVYYRMEDALSAVRKRIQVDTQQAYERGA